MPNWKKIALSGSNPEFSSLNVDNSVSAGSITGSLLSTNGVISSSAQLEGFVSQSGNFVANETIIATGTNSITSSNILALDTTNNYLGINQSNPEVILHMSGDGAQTAQIRMEQYNDSSDAPDIRTRKARGTSASPAKNNAGDFIYRQNSERYNGSAYTTVGQFAVDSTGSADRFRLTLTVSEDGNTIDAAANQFMIDGNNGGAIKFNNSYYFPTSDGNANEVLTTDGSGTLTFSNPIPSGTVSSSAQIASDISGSFTASSASIATDIASLVSDSGSFSTRVTAIEGFSSSIESSIYSYTGSFTGDGSSLTGIDVGEVTLKTDNFTSVTSKQVTHTFGTKDVNVTVYDSNDTLIIPASVTTTDTNTVDITFDTATTGRVVITKGGHIVTGSIQIASSSTVSDTFTAQTSYTASHTFGTSDVFVQVYDNTDSLIIPQKIKILTTGSIGLDFDTATTGKVIIGKSGHIVSGSAEVSTVSYDNVTSKPTLISSSAQIATDISGSFTATSASIASDIANISTDFGSITNNPFTASGTQITASGHIIPSANDTYDLGSTTKQWRDLFLSSGSLYIDGTKIVSSDATTLTFTTDTGQSIKLLETGADDIILQTDSGNIELKGTVEILTGKKITDSAGTKILFGDSIGITGSIDLTGTVDGIDLQAFSSSVATGLASSTADYTQLTNVPSGIISGAAQLPSGTVSGSSQITITESQISDLSHYANSDVLTYINTLGVVSGSVASDWDSVSSKPAGIVSSSAQITALTSYTETFTSQTAVTASHSLGTKNVTVSVYGSDDYMFFPTSIKTHDDNNVYVQFNSSRSGRIIITK